MITRKDGSPLLVFIRGIPGSGKSHLSEYLIQNGIIDNCELIDPDSINDSNLNYMEFFKDQIKNGTNEEVIPWRYNLSLTIEALLHGKNVIWNQPWTELEGIKTTLERVQNALREHDCEKATIYLIVELLIRPELAWNRIQERLVRGGHGPNKEKFQHYLKYDRIPQSYNYISLSAEQSPQKISELMLSYISSIREFR